MVPSDQGLGAHRHPVRQRYPGLVVHLELASFQRKAEVGLEHQALDGAMVEVIVEDLVTVPARLLGPVHRRLGVASDGGRHGLAARHDDADAPGHGQVVTATTKWGLHDAHQSFCHIDRVSDFVYFRG